ncbi:hypothetical protein EJB05_03297, partial [Eragrostis curvula]
MLPFTSRFQLSRFVTSFFAIITACYFILVAGIILYDDTCSSCATTPATAQAASSSSSSSAVPHPAPLSPSWWWAALMTKCYTLVGAGPVVRGLMWRSPPQAALALALTLAAGRRRTRLGMALAFVTVAVTAANHVLFARLAVIICVAAWADAIGIFSAVVFGAYFFVAAVVLLGLFVVLAFLLMAGEHAE